MPLISSKWFTRLWAYKNRNTLNPDVWFSTARLCAMHAASQGIESRPIDYVPVNDPKADERREADARRAEEMMDAE